MYFDNDYSNNPHHAHAANEINLHVKEMEKKLAMRRLENLAGFSNPFSGVRKLTRRIGALINALFLG